MNAPLTPAYLSPTDAHADYVTWLRREVQDAIDDPEPSVTHAFAVAEWEKQADEIRARMRETMEV
jgi:hypothetical protein